MAKNNFIQNLQSENTEKGQRLAKIQREINDFLVFLHSPKFVGVESDGGRKDWIATGDVIARLNEIQSVVRGGKF